MFSISGAVWINRLLPIETRDNFATREVSVSEVAQVKRSARSSFRLISTNFRREIRYVSVSLSFFPFLEIRRPFSACLLLALSNPLLSLLISSSNFYGADGRIVCSGSAGERYRDAWPIDNWPQRVLNHASSASSLPRNNRNDHRQAGSGHADSATETRRVNDTR